MSLVLLSWRDLAFAQGAVSTPSPASVVVEWTTESELNLAGFNLYRSETPEGPYTKVNDALIPASLDPIAGGSYAYTDTNVIAGVTYFYKLEDVELDGGSITHGPLQIAARTDVDPLGFQAVGSVATVLLVGVLTVAALFWFVRRARVALPCRTRPGSGQR